MEGTCGKTILGGERPSEKFWINNKSTDDREAIPGIVRNGIVVPQCKQSLADGTHVEIVVEPAVAPAALKADMDAWDGASDEAWAMIEQWEAEEQ